jgi:branched-chain amino acid transport system substrate-binding protein
MTVQHRLAPRHRGRLILAGSMVVALAAVGCGNSKGTAEPGKDDTPDTTAASGSETTTGDGDFPAVTAPGVTDTEIKVGGIASVTNPLGATYGSAFDGAQAYFDMINADGGIYGRKLVLAETKDDNAVNNKEAAKALIDSDIFAVLPVDTLLFTGADDLVAANIPTFGWTINAEWGGTTDAPRSNLFGQSGSFLGIGSPAPSVPYIAQKFDKHKLGVLAYGVPQSADCATGIEASIDKYGKGADVEVAFSDKSLAYGEKNLSVQVGKMKDAGVDFVTTCMDTNGVVTLATEMDKQGLDIPQYLPNGYDQNFVAQYGDLFEGSVVRTDFAPFELDEADQPEGLKKFLEWMGKSGKDPTENAVTAWMNASQFVDGLKAAGESFDRQKVIDAINEMTDWTGEGITWGVDWTKRHTEVDPIDNMCAAISTIEDSAFVPMAEPGKPFTCIDGTDPDKLTASFSD